MKTILKTHNGTLFVEQGERKVEVHPTNFEKFDMAARFEFCHENELTESQFQKILEVGLEMPADRVEFNPHPEYPLTGSIETKEYAFLVNEPLTEQPPTIQEDQAVYWENEARGYSMRLYEMEKKAEELAKIAEEAITQSDRYFQEKQNQAETIRRYHDFFHKHWLTSDLEEIEKIIRMGKVRGH